MENKVHRGFYRRRQYKRAQFIRVQGQLYALGLEWHQTEEISNRHLRHLVRQSQGIYGAFFDKNGFEHGDGREGQTYLFGVVASARRGRRARVAAPLVGKVYPQAIVVLPVDDKAYWLCAVVNGQVLVGKDVVAEYSQIKKMASELLILNPELVCVGDQNFWSSLNPKHRQEADFEQLLDADNNQLAPMLEHYGPQRWPWMIAATVAVCVVGIAGHITFREWQQRSVVAEEDPAQNLVNVAIDTHNQAIRNAIRDQGLHNASLEWLGQVLHQIDSTPTEVNGWRLSEVQCDFIVSHCIHTWKSIQGVGTFADFVDAYHSQARIDIQNPTTLIQTVSLKRPVSSFVQSFESIKHYLAALPTQQNFKIYDVSILQSLGSLEAVSFGVDSSPESIYESPPLSGASKESLGSLAVGNWYVSGQGLLVLMGAAQLLTSPVFHTQSLTISWNDHSSSSDTHWRLEGRYTIQGDS